MAVTSPVDEPRQNSVETSKWMETTGLKAGGVSSVQFSSYISIAPL